MAATWTATREPAQSGNRRALMISLLFGLVSAFLVYRLLTTMQSHSNAAPTVPVVVTKSDLPARTIVTEAMLTVKQVPDNVRLPAAFTDVKSAVGHVVRAPVSAGEQLLTTKLAADTHEVGFSARIPEGMRAVSINVTEVASAGGELQPGDQVDVVGVFQIFGQATDGTSAFGSASADKAKRLQVITLQQGVQVLAVGQQSVDPVVNGDKTGGKTQAEAKTVTLALAPEIVQKVYLADIAGTLRLSLHRFDDHNDELTPLPPVENTTRDISSEGRPAGTVDGSTPAPKGNTP